MCCGLDYVIIVHVVKAARSLNGLGCMIMLTLLHPKLKQIDT